MKTTTKKIKVRNDIHMLIDLQNFVLEHTNEQLISVAMDYACHRFIKELKDIPLSEELQTEEK